MTARHAWLMLLCACSGATTDSAIEITGYLDAQLVRLTATEPLDRVDEVEVAVIGEPGATTTDGAVEVRNPRSGASVWADASPVGSFVAHLGALEGDAVTVERPDAVEVVSLIGQTPGPFPDIADLIVHAPTTEGLVGVTLVLSVPQPVERSFVLANATGGDVAEMVRTSSVDLAGHVHGESLDELLLYAEQAGQVTLAVTHHVP